MFYKKNKYNINTYDKSKQIIENRYIPKKKKKELDFLPDQDSD